MHLKHEHKEVYTENYASREEFREYLLKKEKKLKEIRDKVQGVKDHHWDYFDKHKLEDDVKEEINEVLVKLKSKIDYISEQRGKLKE